MNSYPNTPRGSLHAAEEQVVDQTQGKSYTGGHIKHVGLVKRSDIHACVEVDRERLTEALQPSNALRISGKWRANINDPWRYDVLLCVSVAPSGRYFLKVANQHPHITLPESQKKRTVVAVLVTYGLGAAFEVTCYPPLSFPTKSTKGSRGRRSPTA